MVSKFHTLNLFYRTEMDLYRRYMFAIFYFILLQSRSKTFPISFSLSTFSGCRMTSLKKRTLQVLTIGKGQMSGAKLTCDILMHSHYLLEIFRGYHVSSTVAPLTIVFLVTLALSLQLSRSWDD